MDPATNQPADIPPAGVTPANTNGLAIGSMLLGIVAVLTGLLVVGALFGLAAVGLGFVALKRSDNPKLSVVGIILGAFGILLTIIALIFGIKLFNIAKDTNEAAEFKTVREFTGESAKFGNRSVMIEKVTRNYEPANVAEKAEDGKELVVVSIMVENAGKSAITVSPEDFKLETADDKLQYEPGFASAPTTALVAGSLQPGEKVTGELVYKIKKDAKGLKLAEKGYDYNATSKRNEYVTYKLAL